MINKKIEEKSSTMLYTYTNKFCILNRKTGESLQHCCQFENRTQRLNESIQLLERYQKAASTYSIPINELAREYLLKARYREDKENFLNSFLIEQSRVHIAR